MNQRLDTITKYLRRSGATTFLLSIVFFLIQGKYEFNSVNYGHIFLALNLGLGILGIYCIKAIGDQKGARTFLGLSLAMIPGQFAHISSLITSNKIDEAILLTVFAIPLLSFAFLGFKVFKRENQRNNSLVYALGCLMVTLPTRQDLVAILTSSLILLSFIFTRPREKDRYSLETAIANLATISPLFIIVGRNAFYPNSFLFYAYTLGIVGWCLFYPNFIIPSSERIRARTQSLAIFPLFFSIILLALHFNFPISIILFLEACLFFTMSFFATGQSHSFKGLGNFLTLILLMNLFQYQDVLITVSAIVIGGLLFSTGWITKEKGAAVIGLFGIASHLIKFLYLSVNYEIMWSWQTLSLLGVLLILSASFAEKYFSKISLYGNKVSLRFK